MEKNILFNWNHKIDCYFRDREWVGRLESPHPPPLEFALLFKQDYILKQIKNDFGHPPPN